MHLFAEASGSSSFTWLFMLFIFIVGTRKICSIFRGSPMARDAAKRGGLAILRNLFK
jgi:hypothetical protein